MEILEIVAEIFFFATAVGLNTFVIVYAFRKPWKTNRVGQIIFGFMLTVAVIFDVAIILNIWENETIELWAEVILWPILAFMVWNLIYIFIKIQRTK